MEVIGIFLNMIMEGLKHEFNIYGYSISYWKIFVFMCLTSILLAIIGGILHGDN